MVNCCVCDDELTLNEEGAAFLMGICHHSEVTFSNVSVCNECYEKFVKEKAKKFTDTLGIVFNYGGEK